MAILNLLPALIKRYVTQLQFSAFIQDKQFSIDQQPFLIRRSFAGFNWFDFGWRVKQFLASDSKRWVSVEMHVAI